MADKSSNSLTEYQRAALAALYEAKTMGLAHATLAGVLADQDTVKTLLISFNALLDPLIEKHTCGEN
ncbi:hypothetical protein [Pantoea ananatis]|uniref:hypothetical protein n=1 Tax=Pantoea ananas TaxID=553 RepID=UPI001B305E03|nr:hypothetical protein [Pantoea ananatis]